MSILSKVNVPTLCHDPRITPQGACRLCLVEIEGQPRPVAACTTPFEEGKCVTGDSPQLEDLRRTLLSELADAYPRDALDTDPDQPFHRLIRRYGVEDACSTEPRRRPVDTSHPLIDVEMSRCINCYRCVQICAELQGQFVWQIAGRGADTHVVPDAGTTLAESSCVSCGACVDTCPTGALSDKHTSPATTWTRTTCGYCGVGCEFHVGTRKGEIVGIRPAMDAPVNRGHLCVKGRYGYSFNHSPERLTTPLIRGDDGELHPATWPEAIDTIVHGLERILVRRGPQSVGVLGSARATNEDNYLTQKFARAVLGTNNVDCCARVCHAPSAVALAEMLGTGAATGTFDDIELADTILVCGSNTTESHPVVGARIKQAAIRGAHLVVIDPCNIELADYADVHLQPRPGTNVLLLNAMAAAIVDEGLEDSAFLHRRVEGFDDFDGWIRAYAPELVADTCGVDPDQIRAAARLWAIDQPSVAFHGLGLTEHTQGTEGVMALVNLALLTGDIGRPGTGINPLRGQNNVQGAAHMGCEPHHLTGYVDIEAAHDRFADIWGLAPPLRRGLDAIEMLDAARDGELKALWVVGWDVLLTQPATPATQNALEQLDLLVVQDIFCNETARRLAHVVLPAASAFEHDGTFMNADRRVQRVRRSVNPPGSAKADWQIFQLAAGAMHRSHLFDYRNAEDIWNEIRQVWPAGFGMTYTRLDRPGGLQWPCPDSDHPGTVRLHAREFTRGPRARLRTHQPQEPADQPDDDHPLVLVTGRHLYQFNAGTMTRRTPIRQLQPTDTIEISAIDAANLGINNGQRVCVTSRYGKATATARTSQRVPQGVVFATFSDPDVAINHLIGSHTDPLAHTPAYKTTAIKVEKAPS